jgi:arylsulfatase
MLTRREILQSTAALPAAAAQNAQPPNVLLLMTDTHRADAVGCWNASPVRTPHLDSIAANGVRFTNCWSQHPVCMPARASIFTGRYPGAHGVRTNGVRLNPNELTLPAHLKTNGYTTFGAGKFHFIPHFRGQLPTMETHPSPYYGFEEFHLGEDQRRGEQAVFLEREHPSLAKLPDDRIPLEFHNSSWIASHTVNFLKQAAKSSKPFFAFASFVDPHQPYNPPPPYASMFKERDMLPALRREGEHNSRPAHIADSARRFGPLNERIPYHRTQSLGEIALVDDSVGRILKTLRETGQDRNTVIAFLSDHGDMLGDHSLFYKGPYHFHQCARVPLIVHDPRAPHKSAKVDGFVQQIDVFPTLTELCGLPIPAGVQGRSLAPVLKNPSAPTGYDSALIEFGVSGAVSPAMPPVANDGGTTDLWTLRTREWRLSHYPGAAYGELYELSVDPEEFVNLWGQPKYREVSLRLQGQLLDRVLQARDPLPLREQPY